MMPTLFFSARVRVALAWLCLMLCWLWPHDPATRCLTQPQPTPPRKRSHDPTPFAGLTHTPPCALCAQATTPPSPMPPTNRRPRAVDTSRHFCPQTGCRYRGWLWLGNLRANSHPNGGPWRPCQCTSCQGYVSEHHGTIFHGKQVTVELIVRVLACLAEGWGIRATARVFEPVWLLRQPLTRCPQKRHHVSIQDKGRAS